MTAAGKPLVKIADLSVMRLKVYVAEHNWEALRSDRNAW